MLDIKKLLTKILVKMTVKQVTHTLTASTGIKVSSTMWQYGNVIRLHIGFRNTSSVSVGNNFFVGTLSNAPLPTSNNANGCCFYGTSSIMGQLTKEGVVTCRNCGKDAVNIGSNNQASIQFIYFTS